MNTTSTLCRLMRGSSARTCVVLLASMTGLFFSPPPATAGGMGVLYDGNGSPHMYLDFLYSDEDGIHTDFMTVGSSPLTYRFDATRFLSSPRIYSWNCEFGLYGWLWEESDGWHWSITTPGFSTQGRADFSPTFQPLPIIIDDGYSDWWWYDYYLMPPPPWLPDPNQVP